MRNLPAFYRIALYPLEEREISLETIREEEVARFSGYTPMKNIVRVADTHNDVRQLIACERAAYAEPDTPQRAAYLEYLEARLEAARGKLALEMAEAKTAAEERTSRREPTAWAT